MPRRVKRKQPIYTEDGAPAGREEFYDYIFPEEQGGAEPQDPRGGVRLEKAKER